MHRGHTRLDYSRPPLSVLDMIIYMIMQLDDLTGIEFKNSM